MEITPFTQGMQLVHQEDPNRIWVVKVDTQDGIAIEASNGAIRYVLPHEYSMYTQHCAINCAK